MNRAFLGSLLVVIAAATTLGLFRFCVRGNGGNEDADAALSRLSKQSGALTYYARYEGADKSDPNSIAAITFYNKPGVAFRFDLPAPLLDSTDDAKQKDDVLKSGDIFIVNPSLPERYVSCRTLRQSCRAADGLELLGILTFSGLFAYDQRFFDQPHTVTRTDDITAVGETAKCFVFSRRPAANKNEQATADASGFVAGNDLPKTYCYASDGIPLGGLVSDSLPNTNWIKAVELKREVDTRAFTPPFPMVPSVYDSTPTAEPSATGLHAKKVRRRASIALAPAGARVGIEFGNRSAVHR